MKYCRFERAGKVQFGLIETELGQERITALVSNPPEFAAMQRIPPINLADAVLLNPMTPSKIVCVGRNYREHAAELGHDVPPEPLIFLKPPSSLLDPGGKIIRPKISARVDHE